MNEYAGDPRNWPALRLADAAVPDDEEDARPRGNYEIQVWKCTGPDFNGYVYDQGVALNKFAAGCCIEMVWLPRTREPSFGNWRTA